METADPIPWGQSSGDRAVGRGQEIDDCNDSNELNLFEPVKLVKLLAKVGEVYTEVNNTKAFLSQTHEKLGKKLCPSLPL